jgi:hypothetical protein
MSEETAEQLFDALFPRREEGLKQPAASEFGTPDDPLTAEERDIVEKAPLIKDTFDRLFYLVTLHWLIWRRERGLPHPIDMDDEGRSQVIFHIKRATAFALNELDSTVGSREHQDMASGVWVTTQAKDGAPRSYNFDQLESFFSDSDAESFERRLELILPIMLKMSRPDEHGTRKGLNLDGPTVRAAAQAALRVMEARGQGPNMAVPKGKR